MAATATVFVIGGVTGIMARHELAAHQIRNRPADIGASDRLNLYLDRMPYTHAEYKEAVTDAQIRLMHERDIWVPPSR